MKKIISFVLVFVLCLVGTVNVWAAEDTVTDFVDVDSTAYYSDAISFIKATGLMTGIDKTHFAPDAYLQRQDLAVIIGRHYVNTLNPELDLSASEESYYNNSMNWVKKHEIMNGYADGNFGVGDYITREDFCVALSNYIHKTVGLVYSADYDWDFLFQFKDLADISRYAEDDMYRFIEGGIIQGYELDGKMLIDPQAPITRGMAAVILERYLITFTDFFEEHGRVFDE